MAQGADATLDTLLRYRVDAVILTSVTLSFRLAQACRAAAFGCCCSRAPGVASVTGENRIGVRAITRHFVALGRRRAAFIAGVKDSSTSGERARGFLERLAEAGLALHGRQVGGYHYDGAAEATRQLLRLACCRFDRH